MFPHDHIPWDGSHPPYLTRPETRRFVRTYYSLWSLLRISSDLWQARLSCLSLRDLYYTHELCRIPQSIGREEYQVSSEKRKLLRDAIWEHIEATHLALHGEEWSGYDYLFIEYEDYDFGRFWDHWQYFLKHTVCGSKSSPWRPDPDKAHLWEESDEDEPVA